MSDALLATTNSACLVHLKKETRNESSIVMDAGGGEQNGNTEHEGLREEKKCEDGREQNRKRGKEWVRCGVKKGEKEEIGTGEREGKVRRKI